MSRHASPDAPPSLDRSTNLRMPAAPQNMPRSAPYSSAALTPACIIRRACLSRACQSASVAFAVEPTAAPARISSTTSASASRPACTNFSVTASTGEPPRLIASAIASRSSPDSSRRSISRPRAARAFLESPRTAGLARCSLFAAASSFLMMHSTATST